MVTLQRIIKNLKQINNFLNKSFRGKELEKMLKNPAGERNKQPILETLKRYIDGDGCLLEISSGVGLHVSYIAPNFPQIIFQPTEYDVSLFNSIKAYSGKQTNICEPVFVDISQPLEKWESKFSDKKLLKDCLNTFDYMLNINMIHISPFNCTEGLFANASKLLKSQGFLFTYGPYKEENHVLSPESNVRFDEGLRMQNPAWGVRDIGDLKKQAEKNSIELLEINNLPSNNKLLVWRKK